MAFAIFALVGYSLLFFSFPVHQSCKIWHRFRPFREKAAELDVYNGFSLSIRCGKY